MKKYILLILIISSLAFTFTGGPSSWTQVQIPVNRIVSDIFFIDSLNGWAVTEWGPNFDTGFVIHSSDGGQNWDIQYNSNVSFKNIFFFNKDTGYLCATNGHGHIYRTLNGGTNWDLFSYINLFSIQGMQFLNPDTGWVYTDIGLDQGKVLKTTNAGSNWIQQVTGLFPQKVSFVSPDTGWFIDGQLPGHLYKSTNGGTNWFTQFTAPNDLRNIYFLNSQTGFIGGPFGGHSLKKTTNGGQNWISTIGSQGGRGISFPNQNTGWICDVFGLLQKSTDGGLNWQRIGMPLTSFYSVFFVDSLRGWVAGGKVLKTTDGGITSINGFGSEIVDDFILSQNYPNPFNPTTSIKIKVQSLKFISLKVYDITGKETAVLVNKKMSEGEYQYIFEGSTLPSGVYFYSLFVDNKLYDTRKMMLVK